MPSRLTVNLGPECAMALDDYMRVHDVTATEAIRRALSVLQLVESLDLDAGQQLAVVDRWHRIKTVHFLT